jgi:hypothetical protein
MNRLVIRGVLLACLLLPGLSAKAQDKPSTEGPKAVTPRPDGTQLKVQIVFSEYEGERKTKSLPYTLLVLAGNDRDINWSKIRIGDRLPVATGKEGGSVQFQYLDVGTNIDCRAFAASEGRFRLSLNLERSWVQADVPSTTAKEANSVEIQFHQPTLRAFRSETNATFRDGQTMETNFATDPVSGKVIKLEITMNVVK